MDKFIHKIFHRRYLWVVMGLLLLGGCSKTVPEAENDDSAQLVILSTTDMHGKCWEENVLTESAVEQNMLRVSTAVGEIRSRYGDDHVILIDNGDTYQGTPVSEVHLAHADHPKGEAEAMSVCLEQMAYDAFVPGNHEFNYRWPLMNTVYEDLVKNDISVLAANIYYDGSDGVHERGENAFGTYITRDITVNGHAHKVGILGIGNTDITRWDIESNYPGMVFAHPDNKEMDMSSEVSRYIDMMKKDGCEMIILAYHGGLGSTEEPLAFATNTENQGLRIIENTEGLNLLIAGHDHSAMYSNTFAADKSGREVPIVNGAAQDLTETVFSLSEDEDGGLVAKMESSENLNLADYEPDEVLEEKIRPYAELADAAMDEPVGTLAGKWDGSEEFYLAQNDTMNLIHDAMMYIGTKRMKEKYGEPGSEAPKPPDVPDHLDVDAAFGSAVNGGYIAHSGSISTRDVYRMYRYTNNLLVIPLSGREIQDIMEENASQKLTCRILNGQPYFYTKNDIFTNIIFGGIDFRYDFSKPEGKRVTVKGFYSGRSFDPDATYLVAVNNYLLENEDCGLRDHSEKDALWSQIADDEGGTIQDSILEYLADKCRNGGELTIDAFNWKWKMTYSEDPAKTPAYEGQVYATLSNDISDGQKCILYNEAQGSALTGTPSSSGFKQVEIQSYGNDIVEEIPEEAMVFTVHLQDDDMIMLSDSQGRFFTCDEDGGLSFAAEPAEDSLSLWQPVPGNGGYCIKSASPKVDCALEYYGGKFVTYRPGFTGAYLFNFYGVK